MLSLHQAAFFVIILVHATRSQDLSQADSDDIEVIETVVDTVANLPCDVSPTSDPEDLISAVIWYKDESNSPFYSVDLRGRDMASGKHWADAALGGRGHYSVETPRSFLTLNKVQSSDAGSYKCRVDFDHSPTRNSLLNLTVIVPPKKLTILDANGSALQSTVVGPITEGTSLQLSCVAIDGRPPPRVSWWRDGVLLDEVDEILSERRVRNLLTLERLERRHLGSLLTCQATNSHLLPPQSTTLSVDLYLRPLEVRLLGENEALSAGSHHDISCRTSGSRPPPLVTWLKGGQRLTKNIRETSSSDGNVTTSILTLTPTVEDAGLSLACRATNTHLPATIIEDTWQLDVHYLPIVSLELGTNLNASSIREGMDVYFECTIKANPWVRRVTWIHNGTNFCICIWNSHSILLNYPKALSQKNKICIISGRTKTLKFKGKEVENNAAAGRIVTNQTLVLQSVSRRATGLYSCVASNSVGQVESKPFDLDVKFEPHCRSSQQKVYGVARLEEVTVSCSVDANPTALWFRWTFNNSAIQSRPIEGLEAGGGLSLANYRPLSETDYGTLLCWARNSLGSQAVPCVFHIVPAGKPDAPYNCSAWNRSQTWLEVRCARGFDGGLPQVFVAEARSDSRLASNVTSRLQPHFLLKQLQPGTAFTITVYASNGKGRSADSAILITETLGNTLHQHHRTSDEVLSGSEPLVYGCVAGLVMLLALFTAAAHVVRKRRRMRRKREESEQAGRQQLEKSQSTQITTTTSLEDDRNPDVIPQTTDIEMTPVVSVLKTDFTAADVGLRAPGNVPSWESNSIVVTLPPQLQYQVPNFSTTSVPRHIDSLSLEGGTTNAEQWVLGGCWPGSGSQQVLIGSTDIRHATLPHRNAETQTPLESSV